MRGVEQIPWLYDPICALYECLGLQQWRHWLVTGAHGRVLDLGCGTGRNLPLLPADALAVGVDPSWDALQRARRRAPRVPLVVGSAEALPFRDATFDTVLSGLVFCSVPDARHGLLEVKRVLRRNGQLRMLEHVRSTQAWKARLQDLLQPVWTPLSGGCYPNRDTEHTVEAAGFRIEGEGRRAKSDWRRFSAHPVTEPRSSIPQGHVNADLGDSPPAASDTQPPAPPTIAPVWWGPDRHSAPAEEPRRVDHDGDIRQ